jgi:SAM-dependent methyltransferase
MSTAVREFIKQKLSPATLERKRYYGWLSKFYLAHSISSLFIRRTPEVEGFPRGATSEHYLQQLRDINVFAPTKMCTVMTKHGSDKGRGWHNYTAIYSVLFGKRRNEALLILELGLGTNNTNLISNMGAGGRPGASLRGWRELFPHALVYGADIDRNILFEEDRIKTFYCDQLESAAIRELWSQPGLQGGSDIIIDDGLHTFEGNTSFLDESLKRLRPGGIYVIEDIVADTIERWRYQLETIYSKQFPNYEFALVMLPNSLNAYDNNLLIARRRP